MVKYGRMIEFGKNIWKLVDILKKPSYYRDYVYIVTGTVYMNFKFKRRNEL